MHASAAPVLRFLDAMTPLSANDAPSITITAADGASARIYLDGAHVTSWIPAGGEEQLFVSARAKYGPGQSIRGGVPICWPQFGASGPLKQHGFARVSRWELVRQMHDERGAARAVFRLTDSDESRALWPFSFNAELSVLVEAQQLRIELTVNNTDAQPIEFTAALHPYFRVSNAFAATVHNLERCRYRDALRQGEVFEESHSTLAITGPIDRVYFASPNTLELREDHRSLLIAKSGFPDAVVWNPGATGTSSRDDFVPGDENAMLCVEAAGVEHPIVVRPGESWTGKQEMELSHQSNRE